MNLGVTVAARAPWWRDAVIVARGLGRVAWSAPLSLALAGWLVVANAVVHLLPDDARRSLAELVPVSYTHLDVYKRQGK